MKPGKQEYLNVLEGDYGVLLWPVMNRLFSRMNVPELFKKSITLLSEKGHIVYAHSTKSTIDALLINYRFKREDLPVPRIIFYRKYRLFQPVRKLGAILKSLFIRSGSVFDNNFYKEYLSHEGNASLLFLDEKPKKSRRDPILELLNIQRDIDTPIFIVPQRLVYKRSPLKVKDATKEEKTTVRGIRKLITLLLARENGFIEHGEPINLKEAVKHAPGKPKFSEEIAADIRNNLIQRLAVLGRNISGAPIRERHFIINKTIKDPILQSFLRSFTDKSRKGKDNLENTVYKYLDQIASDLSPATVNIFNKLLTWIFNNIYDGVDSDPAEVQAVREMARNGSLVYVPCHKSHIDYLILSYFLYHNWMSVPVIAAGINLAFFPMGTFLRKGGAFFMKRTFKDNPLYAQTFAAYVRTILQERIPLEFFIEGGRSRSGKLMLPKKGLLSMIIQGWESGVSRDVIFVPVYVGYDTVVEEGSYIREMKGAPKEKENFWHLLKAGSILKNRYGKVYIRFAKPISLNSYMKKKPLNARMETDHKNTPCDVLAQNIISSIYRQTVATPFSILSCVVSSHSSPAEESAIKDGFHIFTDYLKFLQCNLSSSMDNEDDAFSEAYSLLKEKKLISIDDGETGEGPSLVSSEGENRIHLEYYKNTILNFFVPASLICNVLLKYPDGIDEKTYKEQVLNLSSLLENEFILDMDSLKKAQQYLTDNRIIMISKGRYFIPDAGKSLAVMFDGLIENYLESYLGVAKYLAKTGGLSKKDPLKVINKFASRLYKKGDIKRYEALCLPVYKGALETYREKNLVDSKNSVSDRKALEALITDLEAYLEN